MKQLLLMRHAKSSRENAELDDFDRPLNERGKLDASEMGKRILKKGFIPDLILSSPAKRAFKTARSISRCLEYDDHDIETRPLIYEASVKELMQVIRDIDDHYQQVIMVGHNPSFTGIAGYLSNTTIDHIPTAGVMLISLEITSWKHVISHCGNLLWFDFPRHILSHDQ